MTGARTRRAGPVGATESPGDWRRAALRWRAAASSAAGRPLFAPAATRASRGATFPTTIPGSSFGDVDLPGRGRLAVHQVDGPPGASTLVLLHGLQGTAAGNWALSVPALAREFRVVAPNLRGHGPSSADDVDALMAALDLERAVLVGYSMGSGVAHQVWRRHPERVAGLVLCAAAGVPTERRPSRVEASAVPSAIVVTQQDRLVPPSAQHALARALPGATVHPVAGGHFVFARPDVFVPVLMEACRSVEARGRHAEPSG